MLLGRVGRHIKYAKQADVSKVNLDLGYNRALGLPPKTISPNLRPDVLVEYVGKRVKPIEVASKTDDVLLLESRNNNLRKQLMKHGYQSIEAEAVEPTKSIKVEK